MSELFVGTIIGESLVSQEALNQLKIINSQFLEEDNWHLYKVEATKEQINDVAKNIKDETWYAHFWHGDNVIVVFRNETFEFKHSDKKSWQPAIDYGLSLGIPKEQLDFPVS